jgi:hypothetical protein
MYPHKCCQCGFCCLAEQCPISITTHGVKSTCPSLSFDGKLSSCGMAGIVPIGDGCCIKARCYKDGQEYDFASLPPNMKRIVVTQYRKR